MSFVGEPNNRNINSRLHSIVVHDNPTSVDSTVEEYYITKIRTPQRIGPQGKPYEPSKLCGVKYSDRKNVGVPEKCFAIENITQFSMKRSSNRNPSYEEVVYYKTEPILNSTPVQDLCGVNDYHLEGYRTEICPLKNTTTI